MLETDISDDHLFKRTVLECIENDRFLRFEREGVLRWRSKSCQIRSVFHLTIANKMLRMMGNRNLAA
jgi:hypothetical protein